MNKNLNIIWILVAALTAILGLELIDNRVSSIRGGDAINYILLAKSIATGHGFADINIPGFPPHTQYPPILPLILSPVFYLYGFNFVLMRLIVVLFAIGSVWMVKRIFERESDKGIGIFLALITGTNFYFLFFAKELMTEVPYMFLSLLAIFCLDRYSSEKAGGRYLVFGSILLSIAYLTRMIGITLYAAAAIYFIIDIFRASGEGNKKKQLLFLLVVGGLPFLIWMIRGSLYSHDVSTYESIFMQADYYANDSGSAGIGSLFGRAYENIGYYIDTLPKGLISFIDIKHYLNALPLKIFYLLVLFIMLLGFAIELYRKRGIKDFYILFYFILLAVWPVYGSGDARRYIVPILPFLYFYFFRGFSALGSLKNVFRETGRLTLNKAAVFPVILFLSFNIAEIYRMVYPPDALKRINSAVRYLAIYSGERVDSIELDTVSEHFKKNSPCYSKYLETAFGAKSILGPQDVVMTRKPEVVYLITGGYSVRFPYTKDEGRMKEFIKGRDVDFVLVDQCYPEATAYLVPFISSNPGMFETVFDDAKGTVLLKVKKAPVKPE